MGAANIFQFHYRTNILHSVITLKSRIQVKRAKSIEELIPWLYLKGISTGNLQESLTYFLEIRQAGYRKVQYQD